MSGSTEGSEQVTPPAPKRHVPTPNVVDGRITFARLNHTRRPWADMYHELLVSSWGTFIGWAFVAYVVTNGVFAVLYLLGGDCYGAGPATGLWTAFSFSIQTMTTIGYGAMAPSTLWADGVVALESFVGVLYVALFSGLCFAKFGRPTARVAFSNKAVINRYQGRPCLMFRMANERESRIVDATVHVYALLDEVSAEGVSLRRFHPLRLERDHTPVFAMSWLVMHFLDDDSVLAPLAEDHQVELMSLVVTVMGIESTTMQTVYGQYYYLPGAIERGRRFADVITGKDGMAAIDHSKMNDTVPDPAW
jgi:inward rectifier potassium channel